MTTIKIKSTHPATQGPFIVIDRATFDPAVHELADGEELGVALAGREPTLAELLTMRDTLVRREGELDDQAQRQAAQGRAFDEEAARLKQVADDQAAEAKRLADSSAQLANDRAAFEAGKFATAPDMSAMTKEQLQVALDEKGINTAGRVMTNCLFFALALYWRRRGRAGQRYILTRWSRLGWTPHFLYAEQRHGRLRIISFKPNNTAFKACPPP
eukprot:gene27013-27244_t